MSNKVLIVIVVLVLLAVVVSGCTNGSNSSANFKDISGGELQKMLDNQDKITILDVREVSEYQAGHLKGAKLIPLGELAQRQGELDKSQNIVVVCASGARSAQAAQYLVDQGFAQVYNFAGGMMSWTGAVEK